MHLHRHRRIQERQRLARPPDRRRIAEIGRGEPEPMRQRRPTLSPGSAATNSPSFRPRSRPPPTSPTSSTRVFDAIREPYRMSRSPVDHGRQHRHRAGARARRRSRPDPEERGSGDVRRQIGRPPDLSLLRARHGRAGQGAPQAGNGSAPGDRRRGAGGLLPALRQPRRTTGSPAAKRWCAGGIPNAA